MVSKEDSFYTYEYPKHYKILPSIKNIFKNKNYIKNGKKVKSGFEYSSDNNQTWMSPDILKKWLNEYVKSDDFDKL